MNDPTLTCQDEQRRHKVRAEDFNGLDYLEVYDDNGRPTLVVYFLNKLGEARERIAKENVLIQGGRRITDIKMMDIGLCIQEDPERDDCMQVWLDKYGDFSTYTLCLVEVDEHRRPILEGERRGRRKYRPLEGFDPRYACLEFSFKAGCPSDLDCKPQQICPPPERDEPEINYLAKDYASFCQLILDRLALIMSDWQERHVPDLGIALVELLAYIGDHLSYYQDAVATEAYLDTARQRISVRRHARLVDYLMHEGCNARAWVFVDTDNDLELDPNDVYFITGKDLPVGGTVLTPQDLQNIPLSHYEIFEPLVEGPAPTGFGMRDLKDPACLAVKLRDGLDPVSKYLRGQLSEETQKLLDKYQSDGTIRPSQALQEALVDELGRLIRSGSLYAEQGFAQAGLADQELLRGEARARLNRALLEEAYPQEIARSRKPDDPIRLYAAHREILFYTWGDLECCLPRGATSATLKDDWEPVEEPVSEEPAAQLAVPQRETKQKPPLYTGSPCARERMLRNLQPGDILVFEEVIGPGTGNEHDADPKRRHAVRLTRVELDVDPLYNHPQGSPYYQPIVEIEWAEEDALPFPLCISTIGPAPKCELIQNVSVARGNVILADHGRRVEDESLGEVPPKTKVEECGDECYPPETAILPGKFRPGLQKTPLTFSQPLPAEGPASRLLTQDPRQALPQVELIGTHQTRQGPVETRWIPQRDLLGSGEQDPHFVVEMDNERRAHLRFGDGDLGRIPEAGAEFTATYRVGNGPAGNVGAEMISHLVLRQTTLNGVTLQPRNPLPAQGGTAPEPLEEVKLLAPHAFRTELQRAITADDYAALVMRDFKDRVQRAAAALRWTGSWYEVLVVIDPLGGAEADQDLLDEIAGYLYPYRRIGHDLLVKPAHYVPLDIEMIVCVLPAYLRGHVKAALLDVFSNRALSDGQRGFFHPDNLTFGEGIYLSQLVAAAQAVPGVESVIITKLERFKEGPNGEIESGLLPLGPLEIAQLDNDPSFPENGVLTLNMGGGR